MNIPLGTVVLGDDRLRWVYVGTQKTISGASRHRFTCAWGQKGRNPADYTAVKDVTLIKKFPDLSKFVESCYPVEPLDGSKEDSLA